MIKSGWWADFAEFLRLWWQTRDRTMMLLGLPGLVVGLGLIGMVAMAYTRSAQERSHLYAMTARRTLADERPEAASIFYKKALADRPDDLALLFEAAVVAHQLEEKTRREALLNRLEEEGYVRGILFRGEVALERHDLDEAERCLEVALAAKGSTEVNGMRRLLAGRYLAQGQWSAVIRHLEAVGRAQPDDQVLLAFAYLAQGEREKAESVVEGFESMGTLPKALAEAIRGRESAVLAQLSEARREASDEQGLARWVEGSLRAFRALAFGGTQSLPVLERVVREAPGHPELAPIFLKLSGYDVPLMGVEPMAEASLAAVMASGKAPVSSHLVGGLRALRKNAAAEASVHFGVVSGGAPKSGILLTQCGLRFTRQKGETGYVIGRKLGQSGLEVSREHPLAIAGMAAILRAGEGRDAALAWLEPYRKNDAQLDHLFNQLRDGP